MLVKAMDGGFNGFKFDWWRTTAQFGDRMREPEMVYIIEG